LLLYVAATTRLQLLLLFGAAAERLLLLLLLDAAAIQRLLLLLLGTAAMSPEAAVAGTTRHQLHMQHASRDAKAVPRFDSRRCRHTCSMHAEMQTSALLHVVVLSEAHAANST
jgi:hypothetical protein